MKTWPPSNTTLQTCDKCWYVVIWMHGVIHFSTPHSYCTHSCIVHMAHHWDVHLRIPPKKCVCMWGGWGGPGNRCALVGASVQSDHTRCCVRQVAARAKPLNADSDDTGQDERVLMWPAPLSIYAQLQLQMGKCVCGPLEILKEVQYGELWSRVSSHLTHACIQVTCINSEIIQWWFTNVD